MKTIGQLLKETRLKEKLSTEDIELNTKIKKDFISLLENESWEKLPDYPTVQGFVRTISKELGIRQDQAAALLRRDYPPKKLSINPKPDVKNKRVWSPKKSFVFGISAVMLLVLGYLGVQYRKFVSPPNLVLTMPTEGERVENNGRVTKQQECTHHWIIETACSSMSYGKCKRCGTPQYPAQRMPR